MYPIDFRERLVMSQKNTSHDVNCISAAFYLLGLRNKEQYIDPRHQKQEIVSAMEVIDRRKNLPLRIPDEAVMMGIWGGEDYWHLGIISPFNRDEIIDRPNPGLSVRYTIPQNIYQEFFNRPPDPLFNFLKNAEPSIDFLKVRPEMYLQ